MKVTGKMIRQTVMEYTLIWMERSIKVTGRKISSMERE